MFTLMKQYGRAVLICVTAALIFGILFHMQSDGKTGFIALVYDKALGDMNDVDPTDYTDTDAVKAAVARGKPEIIYTYEKVLPDTAVNLENMFEAKDVDGNFVAVEMIDIVSPSGESVLYLTKEDRKLHRQSGDTKSFLFADTGIYTVYVKAVDAEKKQTYGQYKLPVTSH